MKIHVISSRQMIRDVSTLYLARIDDVHLQTYHSLAEYVQAQCYPQKGLTDVEEMQKGVESRYLSDSLDVQEGNPSDESDVSLDSAMRVPSPQEANLVHASWNHAELHDIAQPLHALESYEDILLVDIPILQRLDVVFKQISSNKNLAVCVMDAQVHTVDLETLFMYPVRALLQLDEVGRNLYDILCEVRAGKMVLTRSAALRFIESNKFSVSQAQIVDDSLSQQTSQEYERALDLFVVFGFSRTDIAHNLCITTHAVSSRIRSGYNKYSVNDRKQAFDCLIGPKALGSLL